MRLFYTTTGLCIALEILTMRHHQGVMQSNGAQTMPPKRQKSRAPLMGTLRRKTFHSVCPICPMSSNKRLHRLFNIVHCVLSPHTSKRQACWIPQTSVSKLPESTLGPKDEKGPRVAMRQGSQDHTRAVPPHGSLRPSLEKKGQYIGDGRLMHHVNKELFPQPNCVQVKLIGCHARLS